MDLLHHEKKGFSKGLEPGYVVILSLLTYGMYHIYWFYKNWTELKEALGRPIRPAMRSIGLFIPILNIFLIAQQFKNIRDVAREQGATSFYSHVWTSIAYIILSTAYTVFTVLITVSLIDEGASTLTPDLLVGIMFIDLAFFSLLGILLVAPQRILNEYWSKVQGLPMRQHLTAGEIAWLVFGGLFWFISVIEIFSTTAIGV